MVRFHWNTGGGQSAFVPPQGMVIDADAGVHHVAVEMELHGQRDTCPALLTLPAAWAAPGGARPLGVVLMHGADADAGWRGPLLEALATRLAARGHPVARAHCALKEPRRGRVFERTFETAAAAPHAHATPRWVVAGAGSGARVAAAAAARGPFLRRPPAGLLLLSYPLLAPPPLHPKQRAGPPDSSGALLALAAGAAPPPPALFLCGELDADCPGGALKELAAPLGAAAVVVGGVGAEFVPPGAPPGAAPAAGVLDRLCAAAEAFLDAVEAGAPPGPPALPPLAELVPSARVVPRAAAGAEGAAAAAGAEQHQQQHQQEEDAAQMDVDGEPPGQQQDEGGA